VSFYLSNPEVRPTGHEVVEFVDTVPPAPAVVDPSPTGGESPGPDDETTG
jgi:hypothetical protein